MVRYAKNVFDLEYIQTIGVNSMDKEIKVGSQDIIMSLWDLGAQKEFESMMPIVMEDALIIFYMFDLSRPETFYGVKEQFRINQLTNPVYIFIFCFHIFLCLFFNYYYYYYY
jgi:GTP-binding protein of the ras superfamily involved in termination of M-phase